MKPAPLDLESDNEREAALQALIAAQSKSKEFQLRAIAALEAASPILEKLLKEGWDTGQGSRARSIIWSLYNGSGLVPLGYHCSGFDTPIAEALAAAVQARLALGADVEDTLKGILQRSGEFERYEQAAHNTPQPHMVIYPSPPATAYQLREMAASIEATTER